MNVCQHVTGMWHEVTKMIYLLFCSNEINALGILITSQRNVITASVYYDNLSCEGMEVNSAHLSACQSCRNVNSWKRMPHWKLFLWIMPCPFVASNCWLDCREAEVSDLPIQLNEQCKRLEMEDIVWLYSV